MARGRRGIGSSRSALPARAPPRAPVPAPRPAQPAPIQQPSSGGGMLSGIGSTIAQGMAFGTGSAIAHRAVGAVAGSMSGGESAPDLAPAQDLQQQQFDTLQSNSQVVCGDEKNMFYECLSTNKGDQQACAFLYDVVKDCQRNQ